MTISEADLIPITRGELDELVKGYAFFVGVQSLRAVLDSAPVPDDNEIDRVQRFAMAMAQRTQQEIS